MKFSKETDEIYRIRLDPGDEIISSLKEFASAQGFQGGFFVGIGAGREFEIGWFDAEKGTYKKGHLVGGFEILSLIGNIGVDEENKHIAHAHITIAGEDHESIGGHLFKGVISVTGEIMFMKSDKPFRRAMDNKFGIFLWEL